MTPLLPAIRDDFGVSITTAGRDRRLVRAGPLARRPAGRLPRRHIDPRHLDDGRDRPADRRARSSASEPPTVETLIVARIGSGIGVAILATVILAALSASASSAEPGKVMSLFRHRQQHRDRASTRSSAGHRRGRRLAGDVRASPPSWPWSRARSCWPAARPDRPRHGAATAAAGGAEAAGPARPAQRRRDGRHERRRRRQHDPSPRGPEHDPAPLRGLRRSASAGCRSRPRSRAMAITGLIVMTPGRDARRPDRAAPGDLGRAWRRSRSATSRSS